MKFLDAIFSGSIYISGSFTPPKGTRDQRPTNPVTASVFFETSTSGSRLLIYNGSGSDGWQEVGLQDDLVPPPPPDVEIEYLVVAGGGGAAKSGGGAGGYLSSSLSSIESGSSITVTVGGGGTGIQGSGQGNTANQGGNSSIASAVGTSFTTVTSIGGGGGAIAYYGVGGDGGSGGGGAGLDATGDGDGGSGTAGQGFDGGVGKYTTNYGGLYAMGGGGGASEAGTDAQNSTVNGSVKNGGDGGDGKQSKITGTLTYYAGGGGGGVHGDSTGYVSGDGGQGGGGDAADQPGSNGQNAGNPGTANTGGGGGGAASLVLYSGLTGGQGGSGVVILAYPSSSMNAAGGIVGDAGNGRKYHQFNESGTLKVGSTSDFGIVSSNLALHLDAGDFASRGTSTWTDLTGNGYNGTVSGATLTTSSPHYTFDGSNDYIYIDQFDHTSTNSVEMWYKKNGYVQYASPYAWGYTPSQRWQFFNADENMYVYFLGSGGTSIYEDSGVDITTSEGWVHILVTADYTADEYRVYKNGSLVTTADLGGQSWSYTGASNSYDYIDIGKNVSNNNGYINANVGQFRIYTKVLSAAEVLQNYNATKTNFV